MNHCSMFTFSFLIFLITSKLLFSEIHPAMEINLKNHTQCLEVEKEDKSVEFKNQFDSNFVAAKSNKLASELSLSKKQKRDTRVKRTIFNACLRGADCGNADDYKQCFCNIVRGPSDSNCNLNEQNVVPYCYCDDICFEFNDCCYKFDKRNMSNGNVNLLVYKDFLECRTDIIPGALSSVRGYWVVSKCPETYMQQNVSTKCAVKNKEDIPVTDDTGIVFWNSFCALCHESLSYKPWDLKVEANNRHCYRVFPKDPLLIEELLTFDVLKEFRETSCRFTYLPPKNMKPRTCFKSLKISEEKHACKMCQNHLKPIIIDQSEFYRNAFCVRYDRWKNLKKLVCLKNDFPYDTKSYLKPLTILFAVRQPQSGEPGSCSSSFQFDSKTGMCYPRKCEIAQCVTSREDDILLQNYVFHIHLYLVSDKIIDIHDSRFALTMFTTCLPMQRRLLTEHMTSITQPYVKALFTSPSHLQDVIKSVINVTFAIVVREPTTKSEFLKQQSNIKTMKWKLATEFQTISNQEGFQVWRIWNLSAVNDGNMDLKTWHFTKFQWQFADSVMYFKKLENSKDLPELDAIPAECNINLLDVGVSNQTGDSISRFIALVNYTMETSSEKRINLTPTVTLKAIFDNGEFVKGILTYVTLSLSCCVVFPTVIIHRYLNLVSSIPGRISEQILIVLFLFNIFFMLGTFVEKYQIFCFIVALITHYLLLSFFTWVNIFICNTLHQFRKIKKMNKNPYKKVSFPKLFFLIGYSVPLAIVLPLAILEICDCTSVKPGYTISACFLAGFPENLVVVVAPVLLCLSIHVICLVYSAWLLLKVIKVLPDGNMNTSKSYLSVYVRLCLISCLSWGFGVLSEALDNNTLRYLFIIFSGLHGLIFSLCIVTTNSFRQLFKEKMVTNHTPSPDQIEISIANNNEGITRNCDNESVQI